MGLSYPLVSSKRTIRVLDTALALWVVLWLVLAVVIGIQMRSLIKLSRTVVASSEVLEQTGIALGSLRDLPVIGERVAPVEEQITRAAASARSSGRASGRSIQILSVLLGISIALIPTIPFLGLYLPLRIAWTREVRSVRQALEQPGARLLDEFLARRATEKLSYEEVRNMHSNPWTSLEKREFGGLSRREMQRLGLWRSSTRDDVTR